MRWSIWGAVKAFERQSDLLGVEGKNATESGTPDLELTKIRPQRRLHQGGLRLQASEVCVTYEMMAWGHITLRLGAATRTGNGTT